MQIRLVPLLISAVAASAVVVGAAVVGGALLPGFMHLWLRASPATIGVWISVSVAVGTALLLATHRRNDVRTKNSLNEPRAGGPNNPLERSRER
jgi:hypothetical protein